MSGADAVDSQSLKHPEVTGLDLHHVVGRPKLIESLRLRSPDTYRKGPQHPLYSGTRQLLNGISVMYGRLGGRGGQSCTSCVSVQVKGQAGGVHAL